MSLAKEQNLVVCQLIYRVFGRFSNFSDGAGLACGVFKYLLSLGCGRPKVIGTTHFHGTFPVIACD